MAVDKQFTLKTGGLLDVKTHKCVVFFFFTLFVLKWDDLNQLLLCSPETLSLSCCLCHNALRNNYKAPLQIFSLFDSFACCSQLLFPDH